MAHGDIWTPRLSTEVMRHLDVSLRPLYQGLAERTRASVWPYFNEVRRSFGLDVGVHAFTAQKGTYLALDRDQWFYLTPQTTEETINGWRQCVRSQFVRYLRSLGGSVKGLSIDDGAVAVSSEVFLPEDDEQPRVSPEFVELRWDVFCDSVLKGKLQDMPPRQAKSLSANKRNNPSDAEWVTSVWNMVEPLLSAEDKEIVHIMERGRKCISLTLEDDEQELALLMEKEGGQDQGNIRYRCSYFAFTQREAFHALVNSLPPDRRRAMAKYIRQHCELIEDARIHADMFARNVERGTLPLGSDPGDPMDMHS